MISCQEAVRRLWEHVEIAPAPQDAALLEAHLALCRRCCGEAEFSVELRGFLSRHNTQPLPDEVAARLEAVIDGLEEGR